MATIPPGDEDAGTLEALREEWRKVEDGQKAFLEGLSAERLAQTISYVNFAGEAWRYSLGDALLHVANHGTYHRGQVVTLLRQLGKEPIGTDYLRWIDEGTPA